MQHKKEVISITSPLGGEGGTKCRVRGKVGQALPDNAPAKGHPAAFTLIELLVVVLIIGILAAVAVPQYQKAVLKSQLIQALPLAKAVHDAEEIYYMENGEYTDSFDKLNIEIQCPSNLSCEIWHLNRIQITNGKWTINYSFSHRDDIADLVDKLYCVAPKTDTQIQQLCASMGKEIDFGNANYKFYILN